MPTPRSCDIGTNYERAFDRFLRYDASWRGTLVEESSNLSPTLSGGSDAAFAIPAISSGAGAFKKKRKKGAAVDFVPVGKDLKSLKTATWNARALYFHEHAIKAQKMKIAMHLMDTADIACFQEIHGNTSKFNAILGRYRKTHHLFCNYAFKEDQTDFDERAGGILTAVKKETLGDNENDIEDKQDVPARISRLSFEGGRMILHNIHNFDIPYAAVAVMKPT